MFLVFSSIFRQSASPLCSGPLCSFTSPLCSFSCPYLYTVDSLSTYQKEFWGVWRKVIIRGVIDLRKCKCTGIVKYWKEMAHRAFIWGRASQVKYRSTERTSGVQTVSNQGCDMDPTSRWAAHGHDLPELMRLWSQPRVQSHPTATNIYQSSEVLKIIGSPAWCSLLYLNRSTKVLKGIPASFWRPESTDGNGWVSTKRSAL